MTHTTSHSKKLTIFEGSDCSGKTTLAERFARETGALYIHFASLPNVTKNLGRIYLEAMQPALLGYQDVVFDRCWPSEKPYCEAFRGGNDRLTNESRRMLERVAMRCGAVLVHCRPPWKNVVETFLSRKHQEMLDTDSQLERVYTLYGQQESQLPTFFYDYTLVPNLDLSVIERLRYPCHPIKAASAGNLNAKIVIVGEKFAEPKDCDSWYQWPFVSFNKQGCSQWVTKHLSGFGVLERELLWVNADQFYKMDIPIAFKSVITLGEAAEKAVDTQLIPNTSLPHPQYWSRFQRKYTYPLAKTIKEVLGQ